jgi:hypothetical protein
VEEDFYSVDEAARIMKLTPAAYARCYGPVFHRAPAASFCSTYNTRDTIILHRSFAAGQHPKTDGPRSGVGSRRYYTKNTKIVWGHRTGGL